MNEEKACFSNEYGEKKECDQCIVRWSCKREWHNKKVYLNSKTSKVVVRKSKTT